MSDAGGHRKGLSGRPLQGHRIAVTAEASIGQRLSKRLITLGALTVAIPCIRVEPPIDLEPLRTTGETIGTFDWIVITSRNGATSFLELLATTKNVNLAQLPRIAVVGPSTTSVLEESGHTVSVVPPVATSVGLLEELIKTGVAGSKTLLLQGDLADSSLQRGLKGAGAQVSRVVAYRTIEGVQSTKEVRKALDKEAGVSAVTLMSGSAARALRKALGHQSFAAQRFVCIGPATARAVEECNAAPARVASPHTMDGLVQAVVEELSYLYEKNLK